MPLTSSTLTPFHFLLSFKKKSDLSVPLQESSQLQSVEFTISLSILTLTEETPAFYSCTRTVNLLSAPQSTRQHPTSLIMAPMGQCCFFTKETRLMYTWKPSRGSGQTVIAISVLLLVFLCSVCPVSPKPLCNFTLAHIN